MEWAQRHGDPAGVLSSGLDHVRSVWSIPNLYQSGDRSWCELLDPREDFCDVGSLRTVGYLNSDPAAVILPKSS
jgi:hypothetical protein